MPQRIQRTDQCSILSSEPKCFDCSSTDCELVGETYAFCDEACRDSFMAGLLA